MSFLSKLLGTVSGNNGDFKISEQLIFDKIIGFRGIVPGVGTSTVVQNTAIALAENTNYAICVLDVNYMYPTQYPMLVSSPDKKREDFLDFSGDLSPVTVETNIRNVTLVSLSSRTIIDMMSSRDSELTVNKLIGSLKSYFDIILVDLGHEPTNINTHAAIKCNKIIGVADQSLKCVYHLQKSINTMATLAVPLAKANKVVLNKVLPDVNTNTGKVIGDSGLTVIGEIPFSVELAKYGVTGKRIYSTGTNNKDIHTFSAVIDSILDEIIQETPLNTKYKADVPAQPSTPPIKEKKTPKPVVEKPTVPTENIKVESQSSPPVVNPISPPTVKTEKPSLIVVESDDEDDINETVNLN